MVELQVRQAWLEIRETTKRTEVTMDALSQAEENSRWQKTDIFRKSAATPKFLMLKHW